jgi:lipoate-protein ligase A
MEFRLDVEEGTIRSCRVYGDFFGSMDIGELCEALVGCRYEKGSVRARLAAMDLEKAFYRIDQEELIDLIC